jgi:MscS family membrane protein
MDTLLTFELLQDLEWGPELLLIVTLTFLGRFIAMRLLKVLAKHFAKTTNVWDDALLEAARRPLSWLILSFGLLLAIGISDGYVDQTLFSANNLNLARQVTLVVLIAWFLVRFISLAEERVRQRILAGEMGSESGLDPTTVVALAKLLRLSVVVSAVLVLLPTLGIQITALLAFGGVGGIAVGFAAQDLLANFFGGFMIYLDRPFAIGDWIRSPDREIEGTVETIGWRLTVVRTFDKRPLYIPNSAFNKLALENPSRMSNRRIKETIGIRYSDASKMAVIVADVKAMLQNHEAIDTRQTLIVNFVAYSSSSLDFFIYTFTKTTNWIEYHEIKQDVMLKIIAIVHEHGADFAFPTRTLDGLEALRQVAGPDA